MKKLNIKTAQIEFSVFEDKVQFVLEKFDESQNLVDKVTFNCYTDVEREYHNWCGA